MSRTAAEALRAAAFACAAVALALCLVDDRADGPRWDVLAALAAGAACAGAWALTTRGKAVPPPAPQPFRGLPSVLRRNPVDWYAAVGFLLAAVAPFAAYRFAAWGEVHEATAVLGCFALVLWGLLFLPVLGRLLVRRLPERHRFLAQDAKAGEVYAVRFELESGEWIRIIDADNPKLVDPVPTTDQMLKLRDGIGKYYGTQSLRPGFFGQSPIGQFSLFAARFKGEPVWVVWPKRWEQALAVARRGGLPAYPVAMVSETGEMVWGYAALDYTDRYLTDPANLHPTVPGLAARPPRPLPAFRADVHGGLFLRLGAALAALTPVLLDVVSGTASAVLGLLAAGLLVNAPVAASSANTRLPDPDRWRIPPIQDDRVPGGH
ncbi:hypothetical protein [Streptomyces griseus]|uniref:hypothetical protein n=1 Tax=Streptomyces griseus TaxID=1911 RepID=UPI0004C60140|nr:hypothetical protein [Streptomyces griseus]